MSKIVKKIISFLGVVVFVSMFFIGKYTKSQGMTNPFVVIKAITYLSIFVAACLAISYIRKNKDTFKNAIKKALPGLLIVFDIVGLAVICYSIIYWGTTNILLALLFTAIFVLISVFAFKNQILIRFNGIKDILTHSGSLDTFNALGMIKKIMFFSMLGYGFILYYSPVAATVILFALICVITIQKVLKSIKFN